MGTDAAVSRAPRAEDRPPGIGPSPGAYLREQRQRRGLSLEQLAAATKIPRPSLEQLEDDNFDALPGAVFVRGFLRCSARALGLDPTAVLELLYEQERERLRARRRERPSTGTHPVVSSPTAPVGGDVGVARHETSTTHPAARSRTRMRLGSLARELGRRVDPAALVMWLVIALVVAFVVLAAFNLVGAPMAGFRSS